MPIGRVTVHTAVPLVPTSTGEWIEGEEEVKPIEGTPFPVLLQLPTGGSEENVPRGRRTIQQPQIIYEPFDALGAEVVLSPADELLVTAAELAGALGALTTKWQVDGDPTPLAKPGQLKGFLARLKRVKD
ncbi:MAG: hypothetical protein ACRDPE_15185 [Solirubrobacterales bacterium]